VAELSGPRCLEREDAERALAWLDRALASPAPGDARGFEALLRAFRGHALDLLGRREEAVAEYDRALALPDAADVHARARSCRRRACDRPELLGRLRRLSQGRPEEIPEDR
jgi:tetratricopeptide (TPR) repeat protein